MFKCWSPSFVLLFCLIQLNSVAQSPILHLPQGHTENITKLLPSKNNRYLVSFSKKDGKIFVTTTSYRKMLYEISNPDAIFYDINIDSSKDILAVSGILKDDAEGFVEFYNISNGESLKRIGGLKIGPKRLPRFSADMKTFVAPNSRGKVGLYFIEEMKVRWMQGVDVKESNWRVFEKVKFELLDDPESAASDWIVTSIEDKGIFVSNSSTGELYWFLDSAAYYMSFIEDGELFIVTSSKQRKKIFNIKTKHKVFDGELGRMDYSDSEKVIWAYDSSDQLSFFRLQKRQSKWSLHRDSILQAICAQRINLNRILVTGFLNDEKHLIFKESYGDTLFSLNIKQLSIQAICSDEIERASLISAASGEQFISVLCDRENENVSHLIHYKDDDGYVMREYSAVKNSGIWLNDFDIWIQAADNTIEYLSLGKHTKSQIVEGKVVAPQYSEFINRIDNTLRSDPFIVLCDDGKVRLYDGNTGQLTSTIVSAKGKITSAKLCANGKALTTITDIYTVDYYGKWTSVIEVWNLQSKELNYSKLSEKRTVDAAIVSNDQKYLFYADHDYFYKWDITADTLIKSRVLISTIASIDINSIGDLMIVKDHYGVDLWASDSLEKVAYILTGLVEKAFFGPTGYEILVLNNSGLKEYHFEDSMVLRKSYESYTDSLDDGSSNYVFSHSQKVIEAGFSPDGKYVLSAGLEGQLIQWDRSTGKIVKKVSSNMGTINDISFSIHANRFVCSSKDQRIKIFDLENLEELATIVLLKNNASITITPENYYYATGDVSQYVSWQVGNKFLSFEQLDLKYNRPDLVLKSLKSSNSDLIQAYELAYLKRMENLKIKEENFRKHAEPPSLSVSSVDFASFQLNREFTDLSISASCADQSALASFNIWMNGVPLYGAQGIDLSYRSIKSLDTAIRVTLIEGLNKIEVSVIDEQGLESYREPYYIQQVGAFGKSARIYFVGIAIDNYANSQWNLRYSVKDIKDIARALERRYSSSLVVDTLFNSSVTPDGIDSIFNKLRTAHPNDKLIISFSGHGLLSDEFDYYLSTYNIDFDRPEQGGYSYDRLEQTLGKLKFRRKLLMIDACHSGEVDKSSLIAINQMMEKTGLRGVKLVDMEDDLNHLGLENSFDLMNQLFLKVGNETGTTVITAAAGTQFAMESEKYTNGVFTYAILELLNESDTIYISDLQERVIKRVPELTNGIQQPTSRSVNYSLDWSF